MDEDSPKPGPPLGLLTVPDGERDTSDLEEPLAVTARRAGWQGCNIVISGLPSVRMVAPAGIERSKVREEWKAL